MMPLVVVLGLGTFDYGRATFEATALSDAAHAGAQYGAQNTATARDSSGIRSAVLDELGSDFDPEVISTTVVRFCMCPDGTAIDCDTGSCATNAALYTYVRVQVDLEFTTLFPYPGVPSSVTLSRTAEMRAR